MEKTEKRSSRKLRFEKLANGVVKPKIQFFGKKYLNSKISISSGLRFAHDLQATMNEMKTFS